MATTILLGLVSAMPVGLAATKVPFSGNLIFSLNWCVDDQLLPSDPCSYWNRAWVSHGIVHVRGWTGAWTLDGTISGSGDILKKSSDVSWETWSMMEPSADQNFNFQAWGTIQASETTYTMFITATIKHGQVTSGVFAMRGPGTIVQGRVTAVDWWSSTATLEGWILDGAP